MGASNPLTGGIESDHELNLRSAKQLEADAQYNAIQRRRVAEKLMGEQIVGFSANNVELSGSAMDIMQEDRVDAEIEAMNITYSGKYQAAEMKQRSYNQRNQAYLGLVKEAGMAYLTYGASSALKGANGVGKTPSLKDVDMAKSSARNYTGSNSRGLS